MNRHLAVVVAALIVNFLAAIALTFVIALPLLWLLFSVVSAATAVAMYGGWRVIQESRLRLTKPTVSDAAATVDPSFRCVISDSTGLLVTYVGPDSCELSRLLTAMRECRRPLDPTR